MCVQPCVCEYTRVCMHVPVRVCMNMCVLGVSRGARPGTRLQLSSGDLGSPSGPGAAVAAQWSPACGWAGARTTSLCPQGTADPGGRWKLPAPFLGPGREGTQESWLPRPPARSNQ